jgi:hypothetical protein
LGLIDELVRAETKKLGLDRSDYRFSRRLVREHTHWSYEQLRVHLGRLVELEYLLVHRGGRGQSFSYELLYDGTDSTANASSRGSRMPASSAATLLRFRLWGVRRATLGCVWGPIPGTNRVGTGPPITGTNRSFLARNLRSRW